MALPSAVTRSSGSAARSDSGGRCVPGPSPTRGVMRSCSISSMPGFSACRRSEEHTSELQSLMRISYAVFCLKKKKQHTQSKEQKLYKMQRHKDIISVTH